MDILLKYLSKEEFETNETSLLFQDQVTNRRFALISYKNHRFRLAWHSDLIKPLITEINPGIFSVGIDRNFAIINFNLGIVQVVLNLFYYFLDVQIFEKNIYIATELEVIKVDGIDFIVLGTYALPDFFEKMVFENHSLKIECAGNTSVEIA